MTTENTIQGYFASLKESKDWELLFADDLVFTSFTSPVRRITGKGAFLDGTRRFYSSIVSAEVRELLCDADKACALTHYELRGPDGNAFTSDVAEIFKIRNGKIVSFDIYFDSAPFAR